MAKDTRYERLFCCECGAEVPLDEAGRVIPALQPGTGGTGGSPRPHVWCQRCLAEEVAEAEAQELERDPAFVLHRYIWTVGEGRTDEEIRRCWGTYVRAGVKLSTTLRELTEAGKIEMRGDRRVALCSPWSEPQVASAVCPQCGKPYVDPECPHMDPRCGSCLLDCDEVCSPPQQDEYEDVEMRDADDNLPTEAELQADRYVGGVPQVDLQDINDRLKRLERLVEHLVIMDNERRG